MDPWKTVVEADHIGRTWGPTDASTSRWGERSQHSALNLVVKLVQEAAQCSNSYQLKIDTPAYESVAPVYNARVQEWRAV